MDIQKSISEMFLEIYNKQTNHHTMRKHFPSECLSEVCEAIASIDELAENRHIHTELKVRRGVCTVEFRFFEHVCDSYPLEKKVRKEFYKDE